MADQDDDDDDGDNAGVDFAFSFEHHVGIIPPVGEPSRQHGVLDSGIYLSTARIVTALGFL